MADENKLAGPSYHGELGQQLARNNQHALPGPYRTELSPQSELAFRRWVRANRVPFDPSTTIQDYDMRGFYNGLMGGDPRAASAVDPNDNRLHYPDVWKTPYHETFSAESQWAAPGAPTWRDDRYLVGQDGQILFDAQAPRERR